MSTGLIPDDVASVGARELQILLCREFFDGKSVFRCDLVLCPEDEGGFSAHCLNLRGVISEGETEAEALGNLTDAFRETIAYYRESGKSIPWGEVSLDVTPECKRKYIVVRI